MVSPVQLSERVYYLPGGVNTAIIATPDAGAILVDTGQDKDYGRKLRQACEALELTPVAIINTHAHADHYGGNAYLLRQFDIPVYAPDFEASIMQSPYLEPVYLFSGAKPPQELLSKWLLAKASKVDEVLEEGGLELRGVSLDIIDTSGHAHKQMSVLVDGVLLAADALFGESILETYPLPFGQDISRQMDSAHKLRDLEVRTALPGHGEPTSDLKTLVEKNLAAFAKAADVIFANATGTTDDVLKNSADALGIAITDLPRYYLNRCVVNAYLSYLRDEGKVDVALKDNTLCWVKLT